eukprot:TRINITY_DN2681_c0_g1_i1.p1 TRINITY_DN2681_c0_g1~~TRINITY_DN2681_c0_g1_i1.p1  ORF type:complete len:197 (+),score=32.46 TRINITY_DN2681_c0_g1_i1:66-593(+)
MLGMRSVTPSQQISFLNQIRPTAQYSVSQLSQSNSTLFPQSFLSNNNLTPLTSLLNNTQSHTPIPLFSQPNSTATLASQITPAQQSNSLSSNTTTLPSCSLLPQPSTIGGENPTLHNLLPQLLSSQSNMPQPYLLLSQLSMTQISLLKQELAQRQKQVTAITQFLETKIKIYKSV